MDVLDLLFVNLRAAITTWLAGFLPMWTAEAVVHFGVGLILVIIGLLSVMALTLGERKVIGRAQDRYGPNRWGPWGILTPVADGIKMLTKEDIVPQGADYWVHLLAPICTLAAAVFIYAVLPFGEGMWGADLNIGILYIVAIASVGTIAILMAGWSSNNKYSLLGAFRVVAQLISYEIPMLFSIVAVVLLTGSMSMVEIVRQQPVPHLITMPLVFFVYLLAAFAELYRAPFDMIEAESELVAGYFTEYSGMKFVMFFMAEYINLFAMSAVITTLFLAGWRGPILPGYVWFFIKCGAVIMFFWWVRSMMPRIRIDHLLSLAWKFLVPLALVNLMVVGLVDKLIANGLGRDISLLAANIVVAIVVIGLLAFGSRKTRKRLQRITARRDSQFAIGLGVVKGLWTTGKHFVQSYLGHTGIRAGTRPDPTLGGLFTVQYPEEKLPMFPRFRGALMQLRDAETGEPKCTACELCVRACPNDVIEMEGEGKGRARKVTAFRYDLARCLFCRLCVEACPFDAIEMSHEYELASYSPDLVWDLEKLLAIGDKYGVHEAGKDWE